MSAHAWLAIVVAGILEVVWAFLMKASHGFTRFWPSVGTVAFMLLSFGLLAYGMRSLPLGTAYAAWTGIGAVGAAVVGIVVLGEPRTALRIFFIATILGGIVGLKLTSG